MKLKPPYRIRKHRALPDTWVVQGPFFPTYWDSWAEALGYVLRMVRL
jgi:hypothetical protein